METRLSGNWYHRRASDNVPSEGQTVQPVNRKDKIKTGKKRQICSNQNYYYNYNNCLFNFLCNLKETHVSLVRIIQQEVIIGN